MAAKRSAEVVWENDLMKGSGTITKVGSGALSDLPVTWASRTEQPGGKTSPEELLAAAHASCYAMAFSAALGRNNTPPERLRVHAESTFDRVGQGFKVTTMELSVSGKVPGLDEQKFREIAESAENGCPISNALRNNVEIKLNVTLEE
jgi:osmotically inducible protein OsmC